MGDEYISEMTQRAKGLDRVCCAWKPLEPKQYCEGVWLRCCTLLPLTGLATSSSAECQAESSSRFSGLVFKGLRIADVFFVSCGLCFLLLHPKAWCGELFLPDNSCYSTFSESTHPWSLLRLLSSMQTLSTPVPTSVPSVNHCCGVHISSLRDK